MSNPVSERSVVRDAIVAQLQNAANCPNLAPLSPDGQASSIIGWGQGDLEVLNDAMVASLGVGVLVDVSSGKELGAQEAMPTLDCPVTVLITEHVTINRGTGGSGLPADYIAEQILAALKNWQVPGTNYVIYCVESAETIVNGTPLKNYFSKDLESAYFTQIVNLKVRVAVPARTTQ